MEVSKIVEMVYGVVGGLGIFLLGMKNMSDGLQAIAGDGLRRIISKLTTNRFLSVSVGFMVTVFVQSSSVTTVMSVGLVNSGLMTLWQSIGVMMGANIGTTITGWILVLKIGKYGLPILGLAALFYLFSKDDKWRFWAMAIMGLGMIFFGLELMKNGFKPLRAEPAFEQWFLKFSAESMGGVIKCAVVGCVLTMIVQSSSATLGVTMGLAATGALNFNTAAALVLGQNIGTTITANLASIGASTNARRAARAHMLFNVLGVLLAILFFPVFIDFIRKILVIDPNAVTIVDGVETYPNIMRSVATIHTAFNIICTVIFIPFVTLIEKIVVRFVPDKKEIERSYLNYVNMRMIEAPSIAIEQSRNEIIHISESTLKMIKDLKIVIADASPQKSIVNGIFRDEERIDMVQKEMLAFLSHLMSGNISTNLVDSARRQIRLTDEFESVSDYVVRILKLHLRLLKDGQKWSDEKMKEIFSLSDVILEYLNIIHECFDNPNNELICEMHTETPQIVHLIKDYRNLHLTRLSQGNISPLESTSYTDLLNCFRKINDHCYNIVEILSLEK